MTTEEIYGEIDLTKEEVDKLEEAIESLRDYGRVHFKFKNGELTFNCKEFAMLREKYKKDLKKLKKGI